MFCAVFAFICLFLNNLLKSILKSGTGVLMHNTFIVAHSIVACYLHLAPEENTEYFHVLRNEPTLVGV